MQDQAGGEGDSHQPWRESGEPRRLGNDVCGGFGKDDWAKTHQMFDLIVGTSAGAMILRASMMGISCMGVSEGLELYR